MTPSDIAHQAGSVSILLLNPNTSASMTLGMETAARRMTSLLASSVTIDTYTVQGPCPASINNDQDIQASTQAVLNDTALIGRLQSGQYDAVLIACFSVHSLVAEFTNILNIPVTGIFEASILSALSLVSAPLYLEQWGIVTTGKFWEKHLSDGVSSFLGQEQLSGDFPPNRKFAGVFSTALNAGDFHTVSPQDVKTRLREATQRLLNSGNVTCVVMGCGGMAGLQDIIRSAAVEVYGKEKADRVYIVDGVQAGILQLQQTVLSRRVFG